MNTDEELQQLQNDLHPIYDEVLEKFERWKDLQTIEQAQVEYKKLTHQEEERLLVLQKRKRGLLEEKRRLTLAAELGSEDFEPSLSPADPVYHLPQREPSSDGRVRPAQTGFAQMSEIAARKRLKKLAHRMRLNSAVLGRINRIVDDVECPLGEALILLDWEVFAKKVYPQESAEMHLARLIEWGNSLKDYRYRLDVDISSLETRFRGWLHVWERWHRRERSPQDQANWAVFISESCRARQEEARRLENELSQLTEEISQLKALLQDRGHVL